jgi:hypothetical protein
MRIYSRRRAARRLFRTEVLVAALVLTGCGGGSHPSKTTTPAPRAANPGEILSVPPVGRFYGRCPLGAKQFTLTFIAAPNADDGVAYRLGSGPPRTVDVRPRARLTWHLTPRVFTSRQPTDPVTKSPGGPIPTTMPLKLTISQGTEPHIYRVDATIALASAIGDTADCALVASKLSAFTYYNGGAP